MRVSGTFWLLACGGFLWTLVPAVSQIVVSQVYGGGGNAGSTYRNDFVELLNTGRDSVRLDGWSVQYAAAAGGTWQVTPLTGSVAPGHYYLIQEAQGSGGTADLPLPEATGGIAMAATGGKVALMGGTVALSGACPAPAGIVDLVGYGSAACYEGSGPAPPPGNTVAVVRKDGGRTDTQDNSADFVAAAPNPRNGAHPPLPVQLVSFIARLEAPIVRLEWVTLTEVNNFGFHIQRAAVGEGAPTDIPGAFVPGCGTSSLPHTYSWSDPSPPPALLLYRLRQVDLDGTEHFSPGSAVDASVLALPPPSSGESGVLRVWPNPFNPSARIEYALSQRAEVQLVICDMLGREVRTLFAGTQEAGSHSAPLDGRALSAGTYFCTLRSGGGVLVRKVVLIH